jgi:PhnB protein
MQKATSYIPAGLHNVIPHLSIREAKKAIEFYKKAFGAEEIHRFSTPDGKIMHADLKIGDSHFFISDEFPERNKNCVSPQTLNGATSAVHLFVPDVDKVFDQAIAAGGKAELSPSDMFWGDRYGRLIDPFGQPWSIATHKEELTAEEMEKRGVEFMKQMALAK